MTTPAPKQHILHATRTHATRNTVSLTTGLSLGLVTALGVGILWFSPLSQSAQAQTNDQPENAQVISEPIPVTTTPAPTTTFPTRQQTTTPSTLQQTTTNSIAESSLTAIPPRLGDDFSLKAKPGEKIQTSIRVRNGSSETVTIQTQGQDFIVDQNGTTPIPVSNDVSNRWSLASWLVLTPNTNEVAPGEIATINVLVEIPDNALPGGHYAMITHQLINVGNTANTIGQNNTASQLQQRVGTLLYVTVDGPINEAAFIRNFQIPRFSEYGPVPFSFEVDNQSDIHIAPQIGVEIYNLFGKKVETIDIESANVFPFIAREFTGEWERIWGFGPYKAKVVMSYGTEGQVVMAMQSFWLLPITILTAILVGLMSLIAIIIVIRRHVSHLRDNKDQQLAELQRKVHELEQKKFDEFDT